MDYHNLTSNIAVISNHCRGFRGNGQILPIRSVGAPTDRGRAVKRETPLRAMEFWYYNIQERSAAEHIAVLSLTDRGRCSKNPLLKGGADVASETQNPDTSQRKRDEASRYGDLSGDTVGIRRMSNAGCFLVGSRSPMLKAHWAPTRTGA